MSEEMQPKREWVKFLVSANEEGQIFLSTEADEDLIKQELEIPRPLTRENLDKARFILASRNIKILQEKLAESSAASARDAGKKQAALQEIRVVLDPWSQGSLFDRALHFLNSIIRHIYVDTHRNFLEIKMNVLIISTGKYLFCLNTTTNGDSLATLYIFSQHPIT